MLTDTVVEHFGDIKSVADLLGIWPQAVYKWGELVPKGVAYELQVRTGDALKVDASLYK